MFYKLEIKDHIRVAPMLFGHNTDEAVLKSVKLKYSGVIDEELGIVVDIINVKDIGEGVVIPGDGASYFDTTFEAIVFKPEQQEVIAGKIKDIADFGAFITMGPIEGMIHVSQTMDDFVSFSKEKVLTGRDSKRSLKVGDFCKARVIAVSFKDLANPKIGLTMRQPGLGKPEWSEKAEKPEKAEKKKAVKKKAAGKKK